MTVLIWGVIKEKVFSSRFFFGFWILGLFIVFLGEGELLGRGGVEGRTGEGLASCNYLWSFIPLLYWLMPELGFEFWRLHF